MGLGKASIHDLFADDILVPAGLHPGARRARRRDRLTRPAARRANFLVQAWRRGLA